MYKNILETLDFEKYKPKSCEKNQAYTNIPKLTLKIVIYKVEELKLPYFQT